MAGICAFYVAQMIRYCQKRNHYFRTVMLTFPNCKINLGLYITEKRTDGYHNLETVFYPVTGLKDALEVVNAPESKLHVSGKTVAGPQEQNLAWKAYQLLQKHFPAQVGPVDIYLHKAIPMGAGMGGGSADGAFALRLLNDFFVLDLSDDTLADMALQLGSDCPFFIYNTPQFAAGRGEKMTPVAMDLSDYSLQILCPEIHVSTAAAFGMITPRPAPFDLKQLASLPVSEWKEKISNDFEAPVFTQHPELALLKEQLYEGDAIYASMSGSGSALYGIFEKGKKAEISLKEQFYFE